MEPTHDVHAAARRMLAAVAAREPHLRFETLAGWVDRTLAPAEQRAAEIHVARCAVCARELAELAAVAPRLAAPRIPSRRAGAADASLATRLAQWWGQPRAWAGAAAVVVVAIAVGVAVHGGGLGPAGGGETNAHLQVAPPASPFDRSALRASGTVSPAAADALAREDWVALARALEAPATSGNASAQSALGLLYAEGLGVPADPQRAARWWGLAAATDPVARRNLEQLARPH